MIAHEVEQVHADLDAMWVRLHNVSGRSLEEIEQARDAVAAKVLARRKAVWLRNYNLAVQKYEQREPAPAWRRWLLDASAEMPKEETFKMVPIAEEHEAHPILKAISTEVENELLKHIEDYPGLVVRNGVQRYYPFGDAGCHLIGTLGRVSREDLAADPNLGKDELRQYVPSDQIGRTGLEKLAERVLRGSRGRVETIEGSAGEVGRVDAVPGKQVKTTIDMELQEQVANMFRYAKVVTVDPDDKTKKYVEQVPMHGAAVVLDIPTNETRVLVSYPTFDLNEFDEIYKSLEKDKLNNPLLNRATQAQLVPGSTVKPMVGLAAITMGKVGVTEGIECDGYLWIIRKQGGKEVRRKIPNGFRCWTESKFGDVATSKHHQIPSEDPHRGHDGNADGCLEYEDALKRSCNVYFETLGDRLGIENLSTWYRLFGLGRWTGIGIPEVSGRLPITYTKLTNRPQIAWHSAIGQVQVTATPLQMANVAATIARNGVWMRPRLFPKDEETSMGLSIGKPDEPDRVDLHLSPEGLAAAKRGMIAVVNDRGGTGPQLRRADMVVAGKTGTATASPLKQEVHHPDGTTTMELVRPATRLDPNPEAPWYRAGPDGKTLNHGWFIGFAPAERPQIAFAVMVEYGISGGSGAGSIASEMLEACVERGYLKREKKADKVD
jgi:penicillin-binding protein 2